MLYDKEFLLKLDKQKNKTKYARITSLKFDETPIESIEGRVTGGSINLDGASALRRSCSLTMTAEQFNHSSYTWGLNTKFKLEIGLENQVDSNYPDIIWFKQGIYLITSFSTSSSTNNFTVSINGKDKMCLLNGEIGGSLESSVDFGTIEEENEDGVWTITKLPIPDIIRNLVHTYAKEPYHNIVINDLDVYGLELLEYRYEVPMYLYRFENESLYRNAFLESDTVKVLMYVPPVKDNNGKIVTPGYWPEDIANNRVPVKEVDIYHLDKLIDGLGSSGEDLYPVKIDSKIVYLTKLQYGDTAGYRSTDLTYAGDLIGNVGEAITSVLDKIRNMLSEFEYFYDVDGRFIFQKKQSFTSTMWGGSTDDNEEPKYRESLALSAASSYTFSGGELITAFNNQPNLSNMRNDYSIWGERTGASGAKIPVHMRYAIDIKPFYYKAMDGKIYVTDKATFENMKQAEKDRIIYEFYEKINSYTMKYNVPEELPAPQKLANGSWSPGWWDIRDWYEYYSLLLQDSPDYTMKWYSRNDYTGCVQAKSLPIRYTYTMGSNDCVWLLIRNSDGRYNPQHGSGNPSYSKRKCTLYHSYYDASVARGYKTEPVRDAEGKTITEYFMYPYAGCSDDHTYLEFLEGDIKQDGNTVYFYNPAFHGWDSYEDLVKEQIEKEFEEYERQGILNCVDWRELIYQMAKDYYQHNQEDDFELKVASNNIGYYPTGMTGYEQYYIDIQGFWRQLYNPEIDRKLAALNDELGIKADKDKGIVATKLYLDYDNACTELKTRKNELKALEDELKAMLESNPDYMIKYTTYKNKQAEYASLENEIEKLKVKIATLESQLDTWTDHRENFGTDHWVNALKEAPETLNFWFDFLDTEGELSQFSVRKIGARPKAINDTNVKSIYFRDTPDVIFYTSEDSPPINNGYTAVQAPEEMFSISAQGKSAKDRLDELIYQHGYCTESASITAIPIYYLEPNTRVYVYDNKTGIDGDYIVSKITLPLTYNGTMSITATKAAETVR